MSSSSSVLVLGSGLLGLCSAYFLHRAGFKVTVIDREQNVAQGASYANGGLLTPSMSEPWNAPGVHWQLLKYLGKSDAPLLLRPKALPEYIRWGLKFLASSTASKYHHATLANIALSQFSITQQQLIDDDCQFDYEQAKLGSMKIFRNKDSFQSVANKSSALRAQGLVLQELNAEGALAIEPSLQPVANDIQGAIYYPGDQTGNARIFCEKLKKVLESRGVEFVLGENIRVLVVENRQVKGIKTETQTFESDQVVVALGVWSPLLLKTLGINLPIKPVKGYSVSAKVDGTAHLPKVAIIDDDLHAAINPLGGNIRLAGTAEFCGWNTAMDPARIDNLWAFLRSLNPQLYQAAERTSAESWCGFRPMSADGLPVVDKTAIKGLFVNAGHGPLGWSQAAGSGALVSQLVSQNETSIDVSPYALSRF